MIRERHPNVADVIIEALESGPHTPTLVAVAESAHDVLGVQGFGHPVGENCLMVHALFCGNLTITNQAGREEVANMRLLRGLNVNTAKLIFCHASLTAKRPR